ncbi:MAG TPA: ABC transporter permease [Chloroflexota bacterium]|nr:ABC transporter permease [Chloroflexota bacterium]
MSPRSASLRGVYPRLGRALRSRLAMTGLALLGVALVLAVAAPLVAPADPNAQELTQKLRPPFWAPGGSPQSPLGTDALGRDVLSRMLFGLRVSIVVALLAVLVSGVVGVTLGVVAGFYGGRTDAAIMRLVDVQLSMPVTLIAIAIIAAVGTSLANLVLVLGLSQWPLYARVVRGEALALRGRDFLIAARAVGASSSRLILRHVLPNTASSIVVVATLGVASVVVLEAGLSFLGLGVQPPQPSLGGMLSEGREYLATAWWLGVFPGLAIMLLVLGINLFGDGLRDLLDPRQRLRLPAGITSGRSAAEAGQR